MGKGPKLTFKQQKFVAAYDGNATQAARVAGYKGNDNTLQAVGKENLRKPLVMAAIQKREAPKLKKLIADREERQQFWTEMMKNKKKMDVNRLRASELLGKSEGDFMEKVEHSTPDDQAFVTVGLPCKKKDPSGES